MMLKPGKQVITIHRLPNISRSKGNQTLKFGQLIEQNMRKLLTKNHTQDVVKIENEHISGSIRLII